MFLKEVVSEVRQEIPAAAPGVVRKAAATYFKTRLGKYIAQSDPTAIAVSEVSNAKSAVHQRGVAVNHQCVQELCMDADTR